MMAMSTGGKPPIPVIEVSMYNIFVYKCPVF